MDKIEFENREFLYGLEGKNMMDDKVFIPFIEYIKQTDWYKGFVKYCELNNINVDERFRGFFYISKLEFGYNIVFVPKLVSRYDVEDNTEKWKEYQKILAIKLND